MKRKLVFAIPPDHFVIVNEMVHYVFFSIFLCLSSPDTGSGKGERMSDLFSRFMDFVFGPKCPHGSRSSDWVDHSCAANAREEQDK